MSTDVAMPPVGEPSSKSFLQRFIGVFVSPGETFDDIVRKPDWIAPLVVMTVVAIGGVEIFLNKIGMKPVVDWAVEHSTREPKPTPEQLAPAIRIQTIFAHAGGVIGETLMMLIIAALGLLIVNAILGGKISFKTAFAIPCYANLVTIIRAAIGVVMMLAGGPDHIISNPSNPTPLSLGFFLDPVDTSKRLMSLGSSLDIATFWFMLLLGVGYSRATGGKVKAGSIFGCYLGAWFIWALIKMGLSGLGG